MKHHWTDNLTRKQVMAARKALSAEMRISDHIQSRRSEIDNYAWVEVFVGRRCYSVTLGPKGGIKSKSSDFVY